MVVYVKMSWLVLLMSALYSPITLMASDPVLKANTSVAQAWQRQQVIVTIDVQTNDPFARLQVDSFKQQGLSIETLPVPLTTQIKDSPSYVLSKKWVVYPLYSGNYTLNLPRVRYRPNRGSIKTLTTPSLLLQVKPLPLYVPPTMPVGKIILQSTWNHGLFVGTKKIVNWQINIQGEGVYRQTMPPLKRKVISTKSLLVLPVQTRHEMKTDNHGINHQFIYSIPLKAHQNGRLNLPEIAVQYFDPELGKLQKAQLNRPFVIALHKALQWILGLVLLAGLITLLVVISQKIKTHINTLTRKRDALRLLEQAKTYQQVRNALNQFSEVLELGSNLTLTDFVVAWKERYNKDDTSELEKAMQTLNAYEFDRQQAGGITRVVKILSREL